MSKEHYLEHDLLSGDDVRLRRMDVLVRQFRQRVYCILGECKGELVYDGVTLPSNPPQFVHKCKACGDMVRLRERYPRLYTEDME